MPSAADNLQNGNFFRCPCRLTHAHLPIALRPTSLRFVWCSWLRACLFCYTRSLNPHPWLLLPPETPNRSNIFFSGVSRHSLFLLACWSLGLIGLSQFLPLFRRLCPPFLSFVPCAPHSLRLILRLRSFVSHRTRFHSRARAFFRSFVSFRSVHFAVEESRVNMAAPNFIPFHSTLILNASSNGNSLHFTSLNRSFRHLPFPAQAPFAKNCASPAARGSIPLPSLRCGLPAACALAPLAYGSRLSLRLR